MKQWSHDVHDDCLMLIKNHHWVQVLFLHVIIESWDRWNDFRFCENDRDERSDILEKHVNEVLEKWDFNIKKDHNLIRNFKEWNINFFNIKICDINDDDCLNEKKESFKNEKSLKLALKIECHVKEILFKKKNFCNAFHFEFNCWCIKKINNNINLSLII